MAYDTGQRSELSMRRRKLLTVGAAAGALFPGIGFAQVQLQATSPKFAHVGCYTTAIRKGHGTGISTFRIDPDTDAWEQVQVVTLVNPSFLISDTVRRLVYTIHGDEDYITTLAIDAATGHLTVIGETSTGGFNGVHLAFDRSRRFMVTANFASGTISLLPLAQDGMVGPLMQLLDLKAAAGSMAPEWDDRLPSTKSHPHQILFDASGRRILVPDKGLDRIFMVPFDEAGGRLLAPAITTVRAGQGPRHGALHSKLPIAWVLNETGSSIVTYSFDGKDGSLHALQMLSATPSDYAGANGSAEIVAMDDRVIFASNYDSNYVGVFLVGADGLLTPSQWIKTGGKSPRFIGLSPNRKFIYACNEDSDSITALRIGGAGEATDGPLNVISTPSPVCIAFS